MQTRRCHAQHNVTNPNVLWAKQLGCVNHTNCGASNVIVVNPKQTRVFGGFATNQGNPNCRTSLGDAANDVGDALWDDLATGDVVGHEK